MSRWHTTEFDFLPEQAFQPRSFKGGMTLEGGGKGGTVNSTPDPKIGEAMMKQSETADRLASFVMSAYEENKPLVEQLQKLNADVIRQQMGMADTAQKRADESYDFYRNVGRPVVEQSITESKDFDSQENIDKARSRVAADVAAQSDMAMRQQQRNLQSMGIAPDSGKMLSLNNQMGMQRGLASVGAMNQAADQRRLQGIGLRQQSANLAQGFPAQSMGQAGQAAGFGSSASGIQNNSLNAQMGNQNQLTAGMGGVGSMYGNVAQGYNNTWANQIRAQTANQNAAAQEAAGWGQAIGMGMSALKFADGGKVGHGSAGHTGKNLSGEGGKISGPGTGTSDQVTAVNGDTGQPIRLSNGEYIVPADVVRAKGVEFFDKLKERYHKPTNLGRA